MQKKKIYFIGSLLLLTIFVGFVVRYASVQSFWTDEMSTIGYAGRGSSPLKMVVGYMVDDAVNLPLYPLIFKVFYETMPYGEIYLLIPSILFSVATIILTAIVGYKYLREDGAFLCICFGTISQGLIYRGAWDIRCYALLAALMALTILCYQKRLEEENYKTIIAYGMAMLFLFFTHWYGAIVMLAFALADMILFLKKRIHLRCIVSYLISGSGILAYLLCMLKVTHRNLGAHYGKPSVEDIKSLLYFIAGGRFLCVCLLLVGVVFLFIISFYVEKEKAVFWRTIIFSCVWTFCIAYFVKNGTFFDERYFLAILPQVILILAGSISYFQKLIFKYFNRWIRFVFIVVLVMYLGKYSVQNYRECYELHLAERQPYRECAEFLAEQGDVYRENTLLLSAETANLTEAWYEYYFYKRGFGVPKRTIVARTARSVDTLKSWDMVEEEEIFEQYDEIVLFRMSFEATEDMEEFLGKYYKEEEEAFERRVVIYRRK